MSSERLRLCVVGLGRAGSTHLEAIVGLADRVELVAVADSVAARADEVGARWGVTVHHSLREALADPKVEAVVLCLPHDLHCEAVVAAAAAGRHVLVEKPMALTTAEADAMLAAAEKSRTVLMVGQSRRFFPAVMESKRQLDIGTIGKPLHVQMYYLGLMEKPQTDWWRSADRTGGLLLGLWGGHALDYVLWMLASRPTRVYAELGHHNPEWEGEDEVSVVLAFPGGVQASITLSFNARVGRMADPVSAPWGASGFLYERHIIGSEGTLQLRDETQLILNGRTILADSDHTDNFRLQMLEFWEAVRTGREALTSGRQVRPVVECLEACRLSAAEHRVVHLR